MATLDTELQQAADQAALAAASQLDGQPGAIARATAAAQSLITNSTLLASDVGTVGKAIDVPTITFCSAFDDTEADTATACSTTTSDTSARVAWVQVGGRSAAFALTPIVGALTSGTMNAEGVAGMSSAICKEPPVMMCNPSSTPGSFNLDSFVGKGIRLVSKGSGASYVPGDFGWLDVGAGASDLAKLMGFDNPPDSCVDVTQPSTETGSPSSVMNEFNTRFDIYESGDSIGCFGQSNCSPSLNSRKDVAINHGAPYTKGNCGIATGGGTNGWKASGNPYRPVASPTTSSKYVDNYTAPIDAIGYPRDKCHAVSLTGDCSPSSSRVGNGSWDINAYWRVNHLGSSVVLPSGQRGYPTSMNATIRAAAPSSADATRTYPTRYQVYKWEIANATAQLPTTGRSVGGGLTDYGQPVCRPPGTSPALNHADRRVLPVAVVNCTGLTGHKAVNPIDWIDAFLVEPSLSRDNGLGGGAKVTYTNLGDIYVEVIGRTSTGTGGTTNQFVRHDKPYLIR
jgi:hypothetical protein